MQYKVEKTKEGKFQLVAYSSTEWGFCPTGRKPIPTLDEDSPYWADREEMLLERGEFEVTFKPDTDLYCTDTVAIPPKEADLWDEAKKGKVYDAAIAALGELLKNHRSVFDGLEIPDEQRKTLLYHFNYSTQY
jgi:hypothetical protein